MKKLPILILTILIFTTCKKDNKPTDVVTGTWSLYSWDESNTSIHANVNQYPCMAGNILTFNKDQTYTLKYIGADTCFVSPHSTSFPPTGSWIGMPGQAEVTGSWSQNGSTVTWGNAQGVISTSNGKTFITVHTLITYNGVTHDIKTVDVKQ